MRWLLHGNLSPSVGEALKRHGHEAKTREEAGIAPDAAPAEILEAARKAQLEIMTADSDFSQAPLEAGQRFGRTIVFLNVESGDVEQDDAIDRLFQRYKRLTPNRLYTVTNSRVKIRQLPNSH